jgi:glycerophosphoryl diester phosphodiesterase
MNKILTAILPILLFSCSTSKKTSSSHMQSKTFDMQAHRGGRGLMPENTIPAMLNAIDLGVTTLEMDVVISADKKVVVSHDPYFNENITTTPEGKFLTKAEAGQRLLYNMTYDSISKYDVGLKPHPGFPRQKKMAARKPLLDELLTATEAYAASQHKTIAYNIEIKSKPENDGKKHPAVEPFTDLVMAVIIAHNTGARTTIQSFDPRALQVMHRKYPAISTSLLIEDSDKRPLAEQLAELGFTPTTYSPHFSLVTPALIKQCHEKNITVIPWTVNSLAELQRLKDMGTDGIITDYPDLFKQLK